MIEFSVRLKGAMSIRAVQLLVLRYIPIFLASDLEAIDEMENLDSFYWNRSCRYVAVILLKMC